VGNSIAVSLDISRWPTALAAYRDTQAWR